jgi:hypothetical protein
MTLTDASANFADYGGATWTVANIGNSADDLVTISVPSGTTLKWLTGGSMVSVAGAVHFCAYHSRRWRCNYIYS